MKLLALETATEACSAALYVDGEISERFAVEPRQHSQLILGMMEDLLADAGLGLNRLDALAFGRGPGSFTGVRIATGVVQGAAFSADLPVVPVSTLAALAQGCFRVNGAHRILPAYDARMNELYWALYVIDDAGRARLQGREQIASADRVELPGEGQWFGAGSGWMTWGERLAERLGERLRGADGGMLCAARDLVPLAVDDFQQGRAVSAAQALPVYLRDQVARKPGGGRG